MEKQREKTVAGAGYIDADEAAQPLAPAFDVAWRSCCVPAQGKAVSEGGGGRW
jgi:hypothetical protein